MNSAKNGKRKRTTQAKRAAAASGAASQTRLLRHIMAGLFGLSIMLMCLSHFQSSDEKFQSESYSVPLPPEPLTSAQLFTDSRSEDYSTKRLARPTKPSPSTLATTTKETANKTHTHLQLEENTHAQPMTTSALPRGRWHEMTLHQGDNLTSLFKQCKLSDQTLKQIIELPHGDKLSYLLQPGNSLRLFISTNGQLEKLMYELDEDQTLVIDKKAGVLKSHIQYRHFNEEVTLTRGTIGKSLRQTLRQAQLSEKQWLAFAAIFKDVVDFRRDLRVGDTFEVLYRKYRFQDNSIRAGDIIAARLATHRQTYQAVYFSDGKNKHGDFFTPEGESLQKSFLRTPVNYKRISSPFNLNRVHPILNVKRPHQGVDLAAARGTPIKATGDARVKAAGPRGGYGKAVELDHGNGITTLYAHMSRFAKKTKPGAYVSKGQVIGYVGSTGLATGPHVHFEYRIKGQPKNPMRVKLPQGKKIAESDKARFNEQVTRVLAQFDDADKQTVIARN